LNGSLQVLACDRGSLPISLDSSNLGEKLYGSWV